MGKVMLSSAKMPSPNLSGERSNRLQRRREKGHLWEWPLEGLRRLLSPRAASITAARRRLAADEERMGGTAATAMKRGEREMKKCGDQGGIAGC